MKQGWSNSPSTTLEAHFRGIRKGCRRSLSASWGLTRRYRPRLLGSTPCINRAIWNHMAYDAELALFSFWNSLGSPPFSGCAVMTSSRNFLRICHRAIDSESLAPPLAKRRSATHPRACNNPAAQSKYDEANRNGATPPRVHSPQILPQITKPTTCLPEATPYNIGHLKSLQPSVVAPAVRLGNRVPSGATSITSSSSSSGTAA